MSRFEVAQLLLIGLLLPVLFMLPLVFAFRGVWVPALACALIAVAYFFLVRRWHRNAQADDALARAASRDATEAGRATPDTPG